MSESRAIPERPAPPLQASVRTPSAEASAPRQRSYQASAETLKVLEELRDAFQLPTDSAVIRRSLALARVLVRAAAGAASIIVCRPDGTYLEIVLRD